MTENPWLNPTRLCVACETPWRACVAYSVQGLKCCKDCQHPAEEATRIDGTVDDQIERSLKSVVKKWVEHNDGTGGDDGD